MSDRDAATAGIAVAQRLPTVVEWAKLDTQPAEERILQDAPASPFWAPAIDRIPRCGLDPLSRFSAVGITRNARKNAAKAAFVRADLCEGRPMGVPERQLQHACYYGGYTFPYQADRVGVRLLQLLRDVAALLYAGAFDEQVPPSRVKVHPATVVLLKHLGHTATLPLGVLLVLYVWAFAQVGHPVFLHNRGAAAKPWHAAVASGLQQSWARLLTCEWQKSSHLSSVFMSVLTATPRTLLLHHEGGFDRSVWTQLMEEGLCGEVCLGCNNAPLYHDLHV